MLYRLLRALAVVSLRWFYGRVDVEGLDRIPRGAPALLAVNHPNALVDAMVVAVVCPRPITFTAKATLFSNPLVAALLGAAGVVPLVRRQDVSELKTDADARRNERAFQRLHSALSGGGAVLIFPEGVTGDYPGLAPLRTGAARMALQAVESGVRDLQLVPVGLTFDRKDVPRSRVFVQVGDPIAVAEWAGTASDPKLLTAELERRLRAVTLNFESLDAAERDLTLARQLARVFRSTEAAPPVWETHAALAGQVAITRRIEEVRRSLEHASPEVRHAADALLDRLTRLRATLAAHRLAPEDVEIDLDVPAGAHFALREGLLLAVAGPVALWGWINHWIPFRLARSVARRSIESAADPAMRTILIGIALVLGFYALQGALVWWWLGGWAALAYWVSLPLAADVNFHLRARLVRAARRARAYLRLRRDPGLRASLAEEFAAIRRDATALAGRIT